MMILNLKWMRESFRYLEEVWKRFRLVEEVQEKLPSHGVRENSWHLEGARERFESLVEVRERYWNLERVRKISKSRTCARVILKSLHAWKIFKFRRRAKISTWERFPNPESAQKLKKKTLRTADFDESTNENTEKCWKLPWPYIIVLYNV